MDLKGKMVLVTGASRGIGASIAMQMAASGASVAVNYSSDKTSAEQVVADIKKNGGNAIAIQADISRKEDVKRLFDETIASYGRIDVLVNNAGIMSLNLIKDSTEEEFDLLFNINVKGTFLTLKEAATRLADNGSIINFSTSVNRVMAPRYGLYVATKAAVEQLTRVFSKEIGLRGINVNSISPGPTSTDLFLKGKSEAEIQHSKSMSVFNRLGEVNDIAKVVVFLASDDAKWITGQNLGVNGGIA